MLTASIPTIGVPLQGASSLLFRGIGYEWADLVAGILDPSLRPVSAMSMQKSGNVAVFWDYENCPAPTNTSGYAIANSISALARSFGSVKVFKAYQEISDQSRSSLRSELQSSGVSLVDCPHNGRKDVADKMILVDMLSYAVDNPAPATILLITGDRDFAYALSILKNRHYRVVLVKRPDTHLSLTFQACICFDWFDDVVHQAENPSSQAEQRPQRAYQRHRQCSDLVCNASSSRPSPWHFATENPIGSGAGTEGTVDITHFLRDRIRDRIPPALQEYPQVSTATDESPRQDQGISSSPKRRRGPSFSASRVSTSDSALMQEKQETSLKAPKLQSTKPETPCIVLSLSEDDPPGIKDVPPVEQSASRSGDTRGYITKPTVIFPKPSEPTKAVLSSISPLSSPDLWSAPALPTTPNPNSVAAQRVEHEEKVTKHTAHSPAVPQISAEELAEKFLKNEPPKNISPVSLAIRSPSPKPSTSGATAADIVKPRIELSVAQKPTDATPANPCSSATSGNDSRMTSQTASGPSQSTGPPVIPPNFVILVEILRLQRSQGVFQSLRSLISARLGENGATYQKAGVSSFRQYALLAEQAGIVDLGGYGGRAWICLKPKWHNVHLVAPTTIPSSTE